MRRGQFKFRAEHVPTESLYHRYNRLLGKYREDRRGRLPRKMANFFVSCLMLTQCRLAKRWENDWSARAQRERHLVFESDPKAIGLRRS